MSNMDAYRCAYRDAKSPLTPINPLKTKNFAYGASKRSLLSPSSALNSTLSSSSKSLLARSTKSSLTPSFKSPLKSTLSPATNLSSYCSTPSKSRLCPSSSTLGLRSTKALTPVGNVNGTLARKASSVTSCATPNSQKIVAQKRTEKVSYRNGEMIKVTTTEHCEEVYFKADASFSPSLALCSSDHF